MKTFFIYIHKAYFPKELHKKDLVQEDYAQWNVKAETRTEAAKKVWAKHGKELLEKMTENKNSLPRKVSLYSGSKTDPTTYAGRLPPILVYNGK